MVSFWTMKSFFAAVSLSGLVATAYEMDTCNGYCSPNVRNFGGLAVCLQQTFSNRPVGPDGEVALTFPTDGDAYYQATDAFFHRGRLPAAVVYAENTTDVVAALECARNNGFRVSPRGKGHSYQQLSAMDGYLVVDMSRTCDPNEIVVDKTQTGDHILPGSKYIGTIKAQAGCTNAIMLATAHQHFDAELGAMALIGSCPSVGITGFTLGGGSGDITPYAGYAMDLLMEVDMVLYNGTEITASQEEHPELFWAIRGGGGGHGIITHLTYKVLQSPSSGGGRKFTAFRLFYNTTSSEQDRIDFLTNFQNFLYEGDSAISSKYGGGGGLGADFSLFHGLYPGGWKDMVSELNDAGLMGTTTSDDATKAGQCSYLKENYVDILDEECSNDPILVDALQKGVGIHLAQFDSYGEAMANRICVGGWRTGPTWSRTSGDYCADLNINSTYCETIDTMGVQLQVIKENSCYEKDVVDAILAAAGEPTSLMNNAGPSTKLLESAMKNIFGEAYSPNTVWSDWQNMMSYQGLYTNYGGLLIPKLDVDALNSLAKIGIGMNHFQHGAPMMVGKNDTAFPWRQSAILTDFGAKETRDAAHKLMLQAGVQPQGYYAYLTPEGSPGWRSFFWDDHYEQLTMIRGDYDPYDMFGKPLTVESIVRPEQSMFEYGEVVSDIAVEKTGKSPADEVEATSGARGGSKLGGFTLFLSGLVVTVGQFFI